jgi:hypothetical protein
VTESMRKRSGYREYRRAVLNCFKTGRRFLRLSRTRRFQQRILSASRRVLYRLLIRFALAQGRAIPRQKILKHFEPTQSRTVARRLTELKERRLVSVLPIHNVSGRWGHPHTAPSPGRPGVSYVSRFSKVDDFVLSDAIDDRTRALRSVDEKKLLMDRRLKVEFVDLLSGFLKLLEPEKIEYFQGLVQNVPEISELLSRAMSNGGIPQAHVIPGEIADATITNYRCLDSEERLPEQELRRFSLMSEVS